MSATFRLGRILGIPVGLHYSWFIVFLLVTGVLAESYFPERYPAWSTAQSYGVAIATSVLFFGSIVAHELGHSVVAQRYGIRVKSITLFVFGGVAQITREPSRPLVEFLIAIAGPLVSVALGGLFLGIYFLTREGNEAVSGLSFYLGNINIMVAVFNLIPGFPLDGGRVFRSLVWAIGGNFLKATRISAALGQGIGYLFIGAGLAYGFWTRNPFDGIWLAFLGWFLANAASSSYRQAAAREVMSGVLVRDIMAPDPPMIPSRVDLRTLVDAYIRRSGGRCYIVGDVLRWEGLVSLTDIQRVPRERWVATRVADIMVPREKVIAVAPEEQVLRAVALMDEAGVSQVPVVEDGRVTGMVARDNILRLIKTRERLKAAA